MVEEYMVGEIYTVREDIFVSSTKRKKAIHIKEGTQGFVDVSGNVHYTSGDSKGKVVKTLEEAFVVGYDTGNISKMILDKLEEKCGVVKIMEKSNIKYEDMKDEIESLLKDLF